MLAAPYDYVKYDHWVVFFLFVHHITETTTQPSLIVPKIIVKEYSTDKNPPVTTTATQTFNEPKEVDSGGRGDDEFFLLGGFH